MADEVKKTEEVVEGKAKAPAKRLKKKIVRQVPHGRAYIQATFNNTIVTLTDLNGNAIAWASSGHCGFKGPKKATPYAAGIVVKAAAEKAAPTGLHEVNVFVRGVGAGRDASVRALNANGLNVLSIQDVTALPHNGCRPPRPRRI
ncbi:MAG: 30S ribosomal protein S11 [Patescibacteria group bacterium]|jgi:small subunit ribosomal protein S11